MKSIMRTVLVLGMALLVATVAGAETHVGDWDVTGEITASGNFATFGDSSYVTPFSGWSGSSRMVAVRQPNAVSSGVSAGFMFSNNQTSGSSKNIAQLMFLNEAIVAAEKRVAQILVTTGGTTNSGKMYFRVFDAGSATNALIINRFGTVTVGDGLTFPDGETQTTAYKGATGGGAFNTASGTDATVGGGQSNSASSLNATVGGGADNAASADYATVGGGRNNYATGPTATIGGGENNTASGSHATVGGGYNNDAQADYATIAGGGPRDPGNPSTGNNVVTDDYGTIGGGGANQAGDNAGTTTDATYATVGGGDTNTASNDYATVGGGALNTASLAATVGGGYGNIASGTFSVVAGGEENTATNTRATVSGGYLNDATGQSATIPGGYDNTASGSYSFAAGHDASATHANSFVWSDNSGAGTSANTNTFNIWASNGVYLNGALHAASDRNKKKNFEPVDSRAVLAKVAALPMSTWNYKTEDGAPRHMGPMGQDFQAAFGLGSDDKHITTVDADGVALAAIQGLNQKLEEKDARIAAQQERIEVLESKLEAVETLVSSLMEN
jgi:hypothetical protein